MSAFKDWLNGLTSKSTPVDADELYLRDSSGTPSSKKLTWANVKAALKAYLDSVTTTLTNKRITPRVDSTTSSATPTINTDNVDVYKLTAQAEAITSFTTNLSGTPTDGQRLIVQITGTAARAITWGASFESSAVTLPTTTVSTDMLTVELMWNEVTSKWRCVYVTSASGASPGGSTTQVQYNNAGAFAGSSDMTFASRKLSVWGYEGTDNNAHIFADTIYGYKKVGVSAYWTFSDSGILYTGQQQNPYFKSDYRAVSFQATASGQFEINSGTAGTYRDLKLRNLIGTGSLATGIVTKTASYTATTSDHTILCDATAGAMTITGFACASNAGKRMTVKKVDSSGNAVTFDPNASETVDGASVGVVSMQYAGFTVQVNDAGTEWHIVAVFFGL